VQKEDYRATLIVMLGLVAANLTGFLRQLTVAYQLGTGRAADIYFVAFAVPEFVFIALPIVLSPTFIPLFAERRLRDDETGAWRFGLQVAGMLLIGLLSFAVLANLCAPLYLAWLTPGFSQFERDQGIQATRMMMPAISLMGLAALAGAALQVYQRFARPALASAVYNLTFVATLSSLPLAWSVGRAAWGVNLGAAAALLLQLPLLWRNRPRSGFFSGTPSEAGGESLLMNVRQMVHQAGPLALGYTVHHIILLVDRAMATMLGTGSAAVLNYAYHLALIVGQLSGLAVSTALFPHLAEGVADNDIPRVQIELAGALRFVWLVGLPASCGLILLRRHVIRVLFEHGAFDSTATEAVGELLVWYGVAALADALCQPLWRLVYAQRRPWTVLAVNGLQTGVRLLGNLVFISILGRRGLALSAAVGLSVQAAVLGWLVRRRLGCYCTHTWWRDMVRVGLATVIAAVAVSLLLSRLSAAPAAVTLLSGGALGGLAYLATLGLLNLRRVRQAPPSHHILS
jgi:putative peptidoglycan lipid II flippase